MNTTYPDDLALLVESSEASAYRSLVDIAREAGLEHCHYATIGGATAIVSPTVRTPPILNRVIGLGLAAPADEAQLDAIAALYEQHGLPWALELSPAASPPELLDWLKARRIRRTQATAMLYRACDDPPEPRTSLEIRPWRPEDGDTGAQLAADVFQVPDPVREILALLPHDSRWRQWLALDNGQVVATSLLYLGDEVAWSGWGATQPTHRGMGIHGALLAARLKNAREHGCSWLTSETAVGTTDTPDQSHRNLTRLGFQVASLRHTFLGMRRAQRTKTGGTFT
ncbi:GNAT family N-acetyltransferase [Rhodocyclaceae bacterium SMB388]